MYEAKMKNKDNKINVLNFIEHEVNSFEQRGKTQHKINEPEMILLLSK
jgi:hypothetical protein